MSVRFIVVDDAPFIRELLKSALQDLGATFAGEAENGVEALDLFTKTLPELVILDLVMPLKNGLETCAEMREIWPEAVIVACSTVDQESLVQKALQSGCAAYLPKPFSKKDLQKIIKEFFPRLKQTSLGSSR